MMLHEALQEVLSAHANKIYELEHKVKQLEVMIDQLYKLVSGQEIEVIAPKDQEVTIITEEISND